MARESSKVKRLPRGQKAGSEEQEEEQEQTETKKEDEKREKRGRGVTRSVTEEFSKIPERALVTIRMSSDVWNLSVLVDLRVNVIRLSV